MANPLQKPQIHVDLSTQRIICTHTLSPKFKYSIKVLQLQKAPTQVEQDGYYQKIKRKNKKYKMS